MSTEGTEHSVAEAYLTALRDNGIKYVFANAGTDFAPIIEALVRAGGVQVKAAELLGMSFRSFRYYVKKYNLK